MSYARSPRPLCSMTIGTRPRPCGSSMGGVPAHVVDGRSTRRTGSWRQDGTAAARQGPVASRSSAGRRRCSPRVASPRDGAHQRLERRRHVDHLRACRAPSRRRCARPPRLEVGKPLGLLVMPADDGVGLLVRLRGLLDARLAPARGVAGQASLRTSSPMIEAERDALLGLPSEHVRRELVMSSGLHPLLAGGCPPCAHRAPASRPRQRARQRELRLLAERGERLLLDRPTRACRASSSLEVLRSTSARRSASVPRRDAELPREGLVERGNLAVPCHTNRREVELRLAPRDFHGRARARTGERFHRRGEGVSASARGNSQARRRRSPRHGGRPRIPPRPLQARLRPPRARGPRRCARAPV